MIAVIRCYYSLLSEKISVKVVFGYKSFTTFAERICIKR